MRTTGKGNVGVGILLQPLYQVPHLGGVGGIGGIGSGVLVGAGCLVRHGAGLLCWYSKKLARHLEV